MNQRLLEYILVVSRKMAETRTLTPLLNYVTDQAIKLVSAERGFVVLTNSDGTLDFRAKRDSKGNDLKNPRHQISRTVISEVVKTGAPLIISNAMSDQRFAEAESVMILKLNSVMCVPLILRGDTIGAIYLENRTVRNLFKETDSAPLILFANQAAVAIENAALNDELEERVAARTKELEQAMIQVQQSWGEAVEANHLRTVWTTKVAHDLRTPLSIAYGALSILQDGTLGPLNDEQMEWVTKSLDTVTHATNLTNDLYTISRIDADALTLEMRPVKLLEFLQKVYEMSKAIPWPETVTLKLDIPPSLPIVSIDSMRINQVLLNLISNAHKFTNSGSVTLYAHVEQNDVLLGVADTGEGIPSDQLDRLFTPFQQVDNNAKRRQQGTGLGLAICRELIEKHGGRIWVESTLNRGSDFKFTLPLTQPVE